MLIRIARYLIHDVAKKLRCKRGGIFGAFDSPKTKTVSTLSPEQEATQKLLGTTLTSNLSAGAQKYTGDFTAPMTAAETEAMNQSSRISALSEPALSKMINYDPQAFNDQFNTEVATPTTDYFKRNLLPTIQESMPTFSTAQGQVTSNAVQNLNDTLLTQRNTARENALNRSLSAMTTGMDVAAKAQTANATPRIIQQYGLDKAYEDYTAGNANYQNNINAALQYLGVQTKAIYQTASPLEEILGIVQSGANVMSALQGGGGTPATVGTTGTLKTGGTGGTSGGGTSGVNFTPYKSILGSSDSYSKLGGLV